VSQSLVQRTPCHCSNDSNIVAGLVTTVPKIFIAKKSMVNAWRSRHNWVVFAPETSPISKFLGNVQTRKIPSLLINLTLFFNILFFAHADPSVSNEFSGQSSPCPNTCPDIWLSSVKL